MCCSSPLLLLFFLSCHAAPASPASPASPLCPADMPRDWAGACERAELLYQHADGEDRADDKVLMPAIGNGFVATFVDSDTIFAAGVFNGDYAGMNGGPPSQRATIPSYLVSLGANNQATLLGSALHLRQAVFLRRWAVRGAAGIVEERVFAALDQPSVIVHEFEVKASEGHGGYGLSELNFTGVLSNPAAVDLNLSETTENGVLARHGTNLRAERQGDPLTSLSVLCTDASAPIVSASTNTAKKYTFLTVVATSRNSTDPVSDAVHIYSKARASAETLFASHVAGWERRSEQGSLRVTWDQGKAASSSSGPLFLASALNASLYAIRSAIRPDFPYGLSPGGLASNAYHGHTFWDQETWMWPPLLMLEPESARAALRYRWDRRHEAHLKAERCGTANHASSGSDSRGPLPDLSNDALMFPWESAQTGTEVQFSKGKIGPWGKFEQHISGDVVLAARQFWYVTGDNKWLREIGYPLAKGVADFYSRRVTPKSSFVPSLSYSFDAVMGPDEFNWPVNNSAYTNAVTRIALDFATEAAHALNETADPLWATVSQGLQIPFSTTVPGRPDLSGGFHPEYDGFSVSSSAVSRERRAEKQKQDFPVKQADTVMLGYPLGVELLHPERAAAFANDLAFYDPLTDPKGPAMTWSVFAIGWMNVKNYSQAAALFQRGYRNNVNPPFNVWSEAPHGGDTINFITGAGGFLQSALFGALGMRVHGPLELSFDPPPPSVTGVDGVISMGADSVNFCGGWRVSVDVTRESINFEVVEASPAGGALELAVAKGKAVTRLDERGATATAARGKATLRCVPK